MVCLYSNILVATIQWRRISPFRETNYSPEFIYTTYPRENLLGWDLIQVDYSLLHQSNGRSEPLSKSWNRFYVNFGFVKDNYFLSLKPWYRIPESGDDNPDIQKYLGYGETHFGYKANGAMYSIMLRNQLTSNGKGAIEVNAAFPIVDSLKIYFQYFNGYGESMIDYNHKVNTLSIGILIYDVF